VVSVAELARFWKDPAAAFVKGLGIPLGGEVVADESLSRSPLALDGLQNWQMKDGILQELLPRPGVASRPPLELVQARLASTRALPPGWLGEVSWNKGIAVVEPIAASLQEVLGDMVSLEYALESGLRISGRIRSSRDGGSWVIYRTGKLNKPKDFLGPWINALLAAACESPRPTLLFDEAHADAPARLEPILPDDARSALDELVRGSFDGQARPLRFAPAASHALAKALGKTPELAVEVAEATWWKRGGFGNPDGEGWSESAQLAWRDRDPFEDRAEWQHYAEAISAPLFQWGRW
jgi:exonuclease V gamma subunit